MPPTIADWFATAAVACALPADQQGHPFAAPVNAARGTFDEETDQHAAWHLADAVARMRARNPALADVHPAAIVMMVAADALCHLNVADGPLTQALVVTVAGEHTPSEVLGWLEDVGHAQYAAYVGGDDPSDAASFHVHLATDARVGCASIVVRA
jgi:Tfp pilus assembly protein PilV